MVSLNVYLEFDYCEGQLQREEFKVCMLQHNVIAMSLPATFQLTFYLNNLNFLVLMHIYVCTNLDFLVLCVLLCLPTTGSHL